jgi:phosphoribosylamine-glycine ligase
MDSEEYVEFLRSVLIKIENALFLVEQKPAKHIPAYNKILGVQQKLAGLDAKHKGMLFSKIVITRSIINYFMNGRYEEAHNQIVRLKSDLIRICIEIKNEKDSVKQTQTVRSRSDSASSS